MLEGCRKLGVPVREMGDCERSERPDEILPETRRCWARPSEPSASGWAAGRPFVSPAWRRVSSRNASGTGPCYLLACARAASLDAVTALDDIGFERDRAWSAVQLQEEAAGVAQDRASLIASPERRRARCAVLTYRLDAGQRLVMGDNDAID
jgi:hypothetical protein